MAGRLIRRQMPPAPLSPIVELSLHPVATELPLLATNEPPPTPPETMPDSPDRVANARGRRLTHLTEMFAAAGISYPAQEVYLRVFKREGQLELWARPVSAVPFRWIHTYPIICASGRLGPKRCEGDEQVPEGFYTVDRFNPRSLFHVSLGLDYPNAADQRLTTDPEHPGTDIFIHGSAVSVGCLAMGDASAEEIYLAARDSRVSEVRGPAVHLFPCRMSRENWQTTLAPCCVGRPDLETLWTALRKGYDHFERTRQLPVVQVDAQGRYLVE